MFPKLSSNSHCSVLRSFGSDAKPLRLKIEFYKEVFLIGRLVAEVLLFFGLQFEV